MTALPPFVALTSVGGLAIVNNVLLTSVSGFEALTSITGNFTVEDNTVLSSCCAFLSFVDASIPPGGMTTISGNATGCSNTTEITNICLTDLTIAGDIPSNVSAILRIAGDLTIGGTITEFPDFAALEVVEGNLVIRGITTSTLTNLANVFPALKSIGGDLSFESNDLVEPFRALARSQALTGL